MYRNKESVSDLSALLYPIYVNISFWGRGKMGSVCRIEPYDGNCDLESCLERLELFFIASNVGAISAMITKLLGG